MLLIVSFWLFIFQWHDIRTLPEVPVDTCCQLDMWHFSYMSVFRNCYVVGSSAAKSVWQHPTAYRQLHSCTVGLRKPSYRHISHYTSSVGPVSCACTVTGRSATLLNFRSIPFCVTQSRSLRYLQCVTKSQRYAFSKLTLRHASSTKTLPTAVSSQVSKRELPKVSDVYRLLSLAKPEKWKLVGECTFCLLCFDILFLLIVLEKKSPDKTCMAWP